MAYYFAPISSGLGDLVVSIPALQALIRTGEPTYLVLRSPYQVGLCDRIEGLTGSLREDQFDENSLSPADTYQNLRAHPLQADFVWGSTEFEAKYPGYKINDVLKGICADYGINADFDHLVPLKWQTRSECSGKVLFIPGSAGIVKCWPAAHWINLAELLKKQNLEVAVIGQAHNSPVVKDLLAHGLEHVGTPTLLDAVDAISSARAVVGVDTGLMHVAVTQGVPTVGLFRYNVMFVRPYDHFRLLSAPVCPSECLELEYGDVPNKVLSFDLWKENALSYWLTWSCAMKNERQHCMWQIAPEAAVAALQELIEPAVR